ncbi:hypothetical protein EAH89_02000 [Roseomonas nepalensis]|uniref:Uncharacterized protein n=1 Tax=Muricoccus nepalensis TaxID=1854500 RepID=A0A502GHJ7_9PROT|nr:hypothetical protein [Roseomonas nepalensis]TPG61345.1 hypothetical protein EAH89_02000 [Roseomonas nepalensis]
MTLAGAFEAVLQALEELRACAGERLHWAVLHARPQGGEHVLAGRYEDGATEMLALAEEAEAAALRGEAAAGLGAALDLGGTAAALVALQRGVRGLSRRLHGLASPEAHAALQALAGSEEGRDWGPWARSVAEALGRCREPLARLEDRLAGAWEEWAELALAAAAEPRGARRPRAAGRGPPGTRPPGRGPSGRDTGAPASPAPGSSSGGQPHVE